MYFSRVKNFWALLLFVFFSISLWAQGDKTLQPFTTFTAEDGVSVVLIPGSEYKMQVKGAGIDQLIIAQTEGNLNIKPKNKTLFSGYKIFIELTYSGALAVVEAKNDALVKLNGPLKQTRIQLKAQDNGRVEAQLQVEQLLVRATFGGIVEPQGTAKNQDIVLLTSGTFLGKAFKTAFTTLSVSAGGQAEVVAKDYLKATVKAGGSVIVFGRPTQVEQSTLFGGTITIKD